MTIKRKELECLAECVLPPALTGRSWVGLPCVLRRGHDGPHTGIVRLGEYIDWTGVRDGLCGRQRPDGVWCRYIVRHEGDCSFEGGTL